MENVTFEPISLDKVERGDVVCVDSKPNAKEYRVLDKADPFILVENVDSHFCVTYHVTKPLYKKTIVNTETHL